MSTQQKQKHRKSYISVTAAAIAIQTGIHRSAGVTVPLVSIPTNAPDAAKQNHPGQKPLTLLVSF